MVVVTVVVVVVEPQYRHTRQSTSTVTARTHASARGFLGLSSNPRDLPLAFPRTFGFVYRVIISLARLAKKLGFLLLTRTFL